MEDRIDSEKRIVETLREFPKEDFLTNLYDEEFGGWTKELEIEEIAERLVAAGFRYCGA